jgi:hypothetical protein
VIHAKCGRTTKTGQPHLQDGEDALVERFGPAVAALSLIEEAETVEHCANVAMLGAQGLFVDG